MDRTGGEDLERTIVEAASVAIFVFQDDEMKYVNPQCIALTGYAREELLGRSFWSLMHPECRDIVKRRGQRRQSGQNPPDRYDVTLVTKSGEERTVDCATSRITFEGRPAVLGVAQDVTVFKESIVRELCERREAERALLASEALHEDAQRIARVGHWALDLQTDKLSWSSEIYRMFDMDPGSFGASYEAFLDAVHPDDRAMVDDTYKASVASGKPYDIMHRLRVPSGATKVVHERGETVYDEEGSPLRSVGTVQDVTDAQHDLETRAHRQEQAQHAQRLEALGTLAGGIAHDFNNYLTAILGNAALAMPQVDGDAAACIADIVEASQHAAELCTQMLAFAGRTPLARKTVDLSSLARAIARLLHVSVPKNVTLRHELATERLPVYGDPGQLKQVLMNLVLNAGEAVGRDNGEVLIGTGAVDVSAALVEDPSIVGHLAEGPHAYVQVTDTGCGMTQEALGRVFDPFYSTKFLGRGLGMSAVLGIVRRHGGALQCKSAVGKGTTFRIFLPITDKPVTHPTKPTTTDHEWHAGGVALVVDDEDAVRAVTAALLEELGFTVLQTKNGAEALEMFREQRSYIRLVLLDMNMPVMGGRACLTAIRAMDQETPVLLTSGYSAPEASLDWQSDSMVGFLQKPYTMDGLRAQLRALLEE